MKDSTQGYPGPENSIIIKQHVLRHAVFAGIFLVVPGLCLIHLPVETAVQAHKLFMGAILCDTSVLKYQYPVAESGG